MRAERKEPSAIQEAGLQQFERKLEKLDQQLADLGVQENDKTIVANLLKEKAYDIAQGGVEAAQTGYDERLSAITTALQEWSPNLSKAIKTSETNLTAVDVSALKQEVNRRFKEAVIREQINRGESAVEKIQEAIDDVVGAGQESEIQVNFEKDEATQAALARAKASELTKQAKELPSLEELQKRLEEKKRNASDQAAK